VILLSRLLPAAITFLVFAASAAGVIITVKHSNASERALRQAQVARLVVFRQQLDEETGVRGYQATGDPAFLKPFKIAEETFNSALATTRQIFVRLQLPDATAALNDEDNIHRKWLHAIAEPLIAKPRPVGRLALELQGKLLVDRFRRDNDAITSVLNRRAANLERQQQESVDGLIAGGLFLGAAFSTLVLWYGGRQRRLIEERRIQVLLYEHEREIADALQNAVIDRELPSVDGLTVHACYKTAQASERVGGDWYDVFALSDGRLFVVVGDVAGHGLVAAVNMRNTRNAVLGTALQDLEPGAILTAANRLILRNRPTESIATVICALIDRGGEIQYSSAGHPPPVVADQESGVHFLESGGLPLGLDLYEYSTYTTHVTDGSLIVFYTDGLTEYTKNLLDGENRLIDGVRKMCNRAVDDYATAIVQDVLQGEQPLDDVAVVSVALEGRGPSPERT
jgi:serine phosphatase RsbU (regulator of sigma subunit)